MKAVRQTNKVGPDLNGNFTTTKKDWDMIIVGHRDKTVSKGDIFNETLVVRKHINGGPTTRGGERFGNNGETGGNQTTCSKVMMIAAMIWAFESLHSPGLGGIEGSGPNRCGWGG